MPKSELVGIISQFRPETKSYSVSVGIFRQTLSPHAMSEIFIGYGSNAPASVDLIVFDCDSNSITSSYTPQQAPSHTTLPSSGSTGSPSGGNGSPANSDGGNGSNSGEPTGTESGSHASSTTGSGGDEKHGDATIAIAAVLSVLGIAAAVVFIVIIVLRRKQAQQRFQLLDEDENNDASSSGPWTIAGLAVIPWFGRGRVVTRGEKARMSGNSDGRTLLGFGRRNPDAAAPHRRIDMLANEDASQYAGGHRRFGSGSSSSWYSLGHLEHQRLDSGGSGRPSFGRIVSDSIGSLKNVGAGVRRVISGGAPPHSRHGTDSSNPWDSYEDDAGLLLHDHGSDDYELESSGMEKSDIYTSKPRVVRTESSEFSTYSDPFKDVISSEQGLAPVVNKTDGSLSTKASTTGAVDDSHSPRIRASALYKVHPITTISSKNSSDTPSSPSLLTASNAGHSSSSSQQVLTTPDSSRPRTSSLIGSLPTSPMKRSDSWWSRFKPSTLRDSLHERSRSYVARDIDIRDPNPPPVRLGAIKEGSGGSTEAASPLSPHSRGPSGALGSHFYTRSGHERSTTSFRTNQTADSGKLERLGKRLDVVFREGTGSSVEYPSSIAGSTETGHDRDNTWSSRDTHQPTPLEISQDVADPSILLSEDSEKHSLVESPTKLISPLDSFSSIREPTIIPVTRKSTQGGNVAARVAEYERRMSLDITSSPPQSSSRSPRTQNDPSSPTQHREYARPKSAKVKYGLVQRPELFVANPDRLSKDFSDSP